MGGGAHLPGDSPQPSDAITEHRSCDTRHLPEQRPAGRGSRWGKISHTVRKTERPRKLSEAVHGGGKFPPPSRRSHGGAKSAPPSPRTHNAIPAYSSRLSFQSLYVVADRSYLVGITSIQQHPTAPVAGPPVPATSLGARLAATSRRAQGLPAQVDDPGVLAELRDLCGLPQSATRTGRTPRDLE